LKPINIVDFILLIKIHKLAEVVVIEIKATLNKIVD